MVPASGWGVEWGIVPLLGDGFCLCLARFPGTFQGAVLTVLTSSDFVSGVRQNILVRSSLVWLVQRTPKALQCSCFVAVLETHTGWRV
jgi:hypothetical protein